MEPAASDFRDFGPAQVAPRHNCCEDSATVRGESPSRQEALVVVTSLPSLALTLPPTFALGVCDYPEHVP